MAGDMMTPAAPAAAPEVAAPADYTITLNVSGGAITVASSKADAGEGEEPASMPAASIKEAVSLVMQIYAADGDMPAADTSDTDFEAGFGKKKAAPMDRVRDMEEMG